MNLSGSAGDFSQYRQDPVGFGEQILGEKYTDDVKKMMESVRDNVITVAKSSNATGKTHSAARICVWWHRCFNNSQVYTAAAPPESNLKRLLWGEIGSVIETHPDLFVSDEITNLNVKKGEKRFLVGVTIPTSGTIAQREAKFSGKHAAHILFVIDEGDAVPDEVYKGIESCMTGGHCRLLIMFNPRATHGEPYRMERDGRANIVELSAMNHPNVITGEDVIPGAVTRETTVRRINQWCRPLTPEEDVGKDTFQLPEFLEGVVARSQSGKPYPPLKPGYYKINEPAFSYMVLGQYPAQATNQLISREWTQRARYRWDAYVEKYGERPAPGVSGIMGLDAAEFGIDANVAVFRYGGFVCKPISWTGVDVISTGDRAADEYKKKTNISVCNVDATGVGAGVAPHMRRLDCLAQSVKVASSPTYNTEMGDFKILRDQLWWSCREWLKNDPQAMLPPDEELLEELHVATYEIKQGFIRISQKYNMREILKRSPDKADALCMTFYDSYATYLDDEDEDYYEEYDEEYRNETTGY